MIPPELIEYLRSFLKEVEEKKKKFEPEFKEFDVVEPEKDVYAIDGGYKTVFSFGKFSIYYLKFGYVKYSKGKRVENCIKESFISISDEDIVEFGEKILKDYEKDYLMKKFWDYVEHRKIDYESVEKWLVGLIMRIYEISLAKDLKGIVLFDFPFDFRYEIDKERFEEAKKGNRVFVGLAKRSRLKIGRTGLEVRDSEVKKMNVIDYLLKKRPRGRWYVDLKFESCGKEFVVKFSPSEKSRAFRTSVDKEIVDYDYLFGELAFFSDDSIKGYLFPLSRIDSIVRVTEREVSRIRREIIFLVPEISKFLPPEVKI